MIYWKRLKGFSHGHNFVLYLLFIHHKVDTVLFHPSLLRVLLSGKIGFTFWNPDFSDNFSVYWTLVEKWISCLDLQIHVVDGSQMDFLFDKSVKSGFGLWKFKSTFPNLMYPQSNARDLETNFNNFDDNAAFKYVHNVNSNLHIFPWWRQNCNCQNIRIHFLINSIWLTNISYWIVMLNKPIVASMLNDKQKIDGQITRVKLW